MKKRKFWLLLLLILPLTDNVSAQALKHYFSLNTVCYTNYFNKERERVFNRVGGNFIFPSLEYKVMRGKIGISIYLLDWGTNYHKLEHGFIEPGEIRGIAHEQIGLNFQYLAWSRSNVALTGFIGGVYGNYYASELTQWFCNPPWCESITKSYRDHTIGLQSGLNLTAEIWKGIYANSNLRFTMNPFAKHAIFKKNLAWEIGMGYKLQRKREKN